MDDRNFSPNRPGASAVLLDEHAGAVHAQALDGVQTAGHLPIAVKVTPAARRMQRAIAGSVVFVPFVAFVYAMIQVWSRGVRAVEVGLLVGMYLLTVMGVTVGHHRHFAHRAFKTSTPMRVLLAIIGSMTAQGPIVFWVAVHRRHHVYSDRPGDPHSPNFHASGFIGALRGFWHGHIGWMFTDEQTSWAKFARDILQDRTLFKIHQHYFYWLALGLVLPAALGGLLTWSWAGVFSGFLWGGLVRLFVANQAMWCVGSVCHCFGSRPFQTHDRSGNVWWVALLTFGEGLQNNHHAFPHAARHGLTWLQPDLSGWIIKGLEAVGLVWDVKHPSARAILEARKVQNQPS